MGSSLTDWIQAGGVLLGVPAMIWGIFSLFRKDKDLERKLESFEKIAKNQDEIAKEMNIQSGHLQYQASLMFQSNKIFEKQLEIQNSAYLADKKNTELKMSLDKVKRLGEIKPYFLFANSMSSPIGFDLKLLNKGADAKNLSFDEITTDFVNLKPIVNNLSVDSGKNLTLTGHVNSDKTYYNSNTVTYEILLCFEDIDGNKYCQNIKKFQNGKYIIEDPILKPEK